MKIAIILENAPDCELAREVVEIPDDSDDIGAAVDDAATKAIDGWLLSIGDTVRIVELEQ
jgi:hypothetical protein